MIREQYLHIYGAAKNVVTPPTLPNVERAMTMDSIPMHSEVNSGEEFTGLFSFELKKAVLGDIKELLDENDTENITGAISDYALDHIHAKYV